MTLIAAVADRNRVVHMIGDRRITNSAGDYYPLAFPKIASFSAFPWGESTLLGASGGIELLTFCGNVFAPPLLPEETSDSALDRWCATGFRQKFSGMILDQKVARKDKDGEFELPGQILLAARGCIFSFQRKVFPLRIVRPYDAIGSGEDFCLGVLNSAMRGKDPLSSGECKDLLIESMRAAVDMKNSVGAPFDYFTTEGGFDMIEK